ncbi:MAG: hypothetical protein J6386_14825 [Candidatus Synoicihabitans palmerolidicus]|nr:hypothetical protein [Candidatus Synoicihabitans palmerolidicus]
MGTEIEDGNRLSHGGSKSTLGAGIKWRCSWINNSQVIVPHNASVPISKYQTSVLMAARRTSRRVDIAASRINVITADTMKRGFSTFLFKTSVVTPIMKNPQTQKQRSHHETVNYGGSGEIEHKELSAKLNATIVQALMAGTPLPVVERS